MHIICRESIETVQPISGYTLDGKSAVDTYKCPGILVNYLGLKHMHAEVFSSRIPALYADSDDKRGRGVSERKGAGRCSRERQKMTSYFKRTDMSPRIGRERPLN